MTEYLEGYGLRLRAWAESDVDTLVRACNDPDIARYLPHLPQPYTSDDARWWINEGSKSSDIPFAASAVVDAETGELLGTVGLGNFHKERAQMELGYWTAPWARGRGVASRAAKILSAHAFALGVQRLELLTALPNTPSQRVALAAGFTREGVRRNAGSNREGDRQDLIAWVRFPGDPEGPTPRVLPDFAEGQLTDGVIVLRPMNSGDVEDFFTLSNLPDVVTTQVGPLRSREFVETRCGQTEMEWLAGSKASCVILDAETGRFAGDIELYYFEPHAKQAMIGYGLMPDFRRKGYATRAAKLISDWAFENGIVRVIAGTFPYNEASRRVLERAGFEREAYQKARLPGRDGRIDNIQYAKVAPGLGG